MTERLVSMLIVAGELLTVLAVAVGLLVWQISRRRTRERAAARSLVEKVKASEAERLAQLRQVLKDTYQLDDAALDENAESLMKLEKTLYSRFLRSFLGQDPESLDTLHDTVQSLVKGYRDLVPAASTESQDPPPEVATENQRLQEQVDTLQQENQRLQGELEETNNAMDQMVREYVSMYGGSHEEAMRKLGRPPKKAESQ